MAKVVNYSSGDGKFTIDIGIDELNEYIFLVKALAELGIDYESDNVIEINTLSVDIVLDKNENKLKIIIYR